MVRRYDATACGTVGVNYPSLWPMSRKRRKSAPDDVDFNGPGTPGEAAAFTPGSDAAIEAYRERAANRQLMFHPADRFVAPPPEEPVWRSRRYSYFVYRANAARPYRVYGTRLHPLPPATDPNCLWRGSDYRQALTVAQQENRKRRRNQPKRRKRKRAFR